MKKLLISTAIIGLAAAPALADENTLAPNKQGEPASVTEQFIDTDSEVTGSIASDDAMNGIDAKDSGVPATLNDEVEIVTEGMAPTGEIGDIDENDVSNSKKGLPLDEQSDS